MTVLALRFDFRSPRIFAALCFTALASTGPAASQGLSVEPGALPSQDVMSLAEGGVDKAVAALPDIVAEIMQRSGVPGVAVAVVHGDRTVFAEGYGVRELGKDARVDADTVFQLASLSKPISGTVGAIQVTSGVVGWDDKAVSHLPSLRLSDDFVTANATIGDFYAHRTGLPPAAGDDLEDMGYPRATVLERLRLLPLDAFRTSYHYANFGITVGAEAVAAASGKAWEELADEVLFAPLGMTSTSFRHADFVGRDNRATLHAFEDGRFQPLYQRDADAQAPAGGASSSVNDLAKWLKLLLAEGVHEGRPMISPEALLPALQPQAFSLPPHSGDARAGFYGFGFNVSVGANGRPSMGHSGAFLLGAATNMQIIPSADLAVVALTNGGPVGAAEAIVAQFMDIAQFGEAKRDWFALANPAMLGYYDPLGDLVGKEPPAGAAQARPLEDYAGVYESAYFGPARIEVGDEGLIFIAGPAEFTLSLTHWDGDTFAAAPRNENAPSGSLSSLKFSAEEGRITGFTIDYLNDSGMAVWSR